MIKESKYIIRKIIIGVGIALCLAFLNGCKVKALNSNVSYVLSSNNNDFYDENEYNYLGTYNTSSRYPIYVNLYYKNDILYFSTVNNSLILDTTQEAMDGFSLNTMFLQQNSIYGSYNGLFVYDTNSYIKSYYNGKNFCYTTKYHNIGFIYLHLVIYGSNNTISGLSINGGYNDDNGVDTSNNCSDTSIVPNIYNNRDFLVYNGSPVYDSEFTDNTLIDASTISSSVPYFISFHQTTISNNNLIMGYNFSPEFSIFDTENYVYQYKFGENSTTWLSLTENEQNIRINGNGTIYVRIKDLVNDNVIDSATFTISDIGQFYDSNIDYKITFNGEYRTENYLNDNVSSSPSVIKEYIINVDYSPKSSILTYQYQYVLENNSIDNNNWQTLASSNNGSFGYVASQNGILYARILDKENNVLTTSTFTVNAIGKLALDSYNPQFENFFTKLSNKINYGGPISAIFRLPVNFLSKFYDKAKVNACTPYRLSQLLGVDFYLPCIDLKSYIGDTYYHMIDIMLCIIFTLNLIKFLYIIYNKFVSLEEVD